LDKDIIQVQGIGGVVSLSIASEDSISGTGTCGANLWTLKFYIKLASSLQGKVCWTYLVELIDKSVIWELGSLVREVIISLLTGQPE
jgi:hypothetical protein